MRWSPELNTYVRYKGLFADYTLTAMHRAVRNNPAINNEPLYGSNQPDQSHRVDVGGTWNPATDFMLTAQVGVQNSWQSSQFSRFSEVNYPFFLNAWWAATERLSLSGGYSYFSNCIDQDTSIGFRLEAPPARMEETQWSYAGQNNLINFNATYVLTSSATFRLLRMESGQQYLLRARLARGSELVRVELVLRRRTPVISGLGI